MINLLSTPLFLQICYYLLCHDKHSVIEFFMKQNKTLFNQLKYKKIILNLGLKIIRAY